MALEKHPHTEIAEFIKVYEQKIHTEVLEGKVSKESRNLIDKSWGIFEDNKRIFEGIGNEDAVLRYGIALIYLKQPIMMGDFTSTAERYLNEIHSILGQDEDFKISMERDV